MARIASLAATLLLLWGAAAVAAEPENSDVTATTCAEMAMGSELDRAFSLLFYYGYLAGREGTTVIDASAVPGHLEAVRDFCNANPDSTVVDAFVSALKP